MPVKTPKKRKIPHSHLNRYEYAKARSDNGICQRCTKPRDPRYVYCLDCKSKVARHTFKWLRQREAAGLCYSCPARVDSTHRYCENCKGRRREYNNGWYTRVPKIWREPLPSNVQLKVTAVAFRLDIDLHRAMKFVMMKRMVRAKWADILVEACCLWLQRQKGYDELDRSITSKVDEYIEYMDKYRRHTQRYEDLVEQGKEVPVDDDPIH